MEDIKIAWKYFWQNDNDKDALYDFASGLISFLKFKKRIISKKALKETDKMGLLPIQTLKHRAYCALNAHGSPISGFRRYVEKWPIP